MASNLQNAAARALIKPNPSSFYDTFNSNKKTNPVLLSFKKEKKNFIAFVTDKKASKLLLNSELNSRLSMMLFDVWNKYQSLIPQDYFWKQLLKIGNFLVEHKVYSVALPVCFDRLLTELKIKNYDLKSTDLSDYQNWYFPNGLESDMTSMIIQALIGKYICTFHSVKKFNPMLTCGRAVNECIYILSLLRNITQILLPHENWCWLLYNCTIHIYTISQDMMMLGFSAKVLEFLVWACMCLENSLPLLGVNFLTWRTTLYMAICQCYWDSMSGQQAEAFARRGLCKISDLWQIEKLKQDNQILTNEVNSMFRESTLKMALMIFRRGVFETRKKHRTVVRAKNRFNIKDFINLSWPRTQTEKILVEMFDCASAQFMAILESLNNSRQRIAQPNACSQWEVELIDSVAELFYAAKEILMGNTGTNTVSKKARKDQPVSGFVHLIVEESCLMELATAGDHRIPLRAVFQLARLSFSYEQWDIFDFFLDPMKAVSHRKYTWDIKTLEILSAIEKLVSGRKRRKSQTTILIPTDDELSKTDLTQNASATSVGTTKTNGDELIPLAQVLKTVYSQSFDDQEVDFGLVVDAVLLLWNRSKVFIQRHQSGLEDKSRYFQKPENQNKWLHVLEVIVYTMCWCGMVSIDPTILMEAAMRFALLLETSSSSTSIQKTTETPKGPMKDPSGMSFFASEEDLLSSSACSLGTDFMSQTQNKMLETAKIALEAVLKEIAKGKNLDERHIADVSWIMQQNAEVSTKTQADEEGNEKPTKAENPFQHLRLFESTIRCQHTELLLIYYRVTLTLRNLEIIQARALVKAYKKPDPKLMTQYLKVLELMEAGCKANNLKKSLLYMQASINMTTCTMQERKQMLEQSVAFLEKYQKEELKLFETTTNAIKNTNPTNQKIPPPPILLHRSGSKMIFKPAPFVSSDGDVVCWYRLFAHKITCSNAKVRLNDMQNSGTGELVLYDCEEICISELELNQRYIFALAAYTSEGKLIGGSIGENTKPILAMNPISILMTYSFLCQYASQLGFYSISQNAFNFLWAHFVLVDQQKASPDSFITTSFHQFRISRPKLNKQMLSSTAVSPLLMRQMYCCWMSQVEIAIQQGDLTCTKLCEQGPFIEGQKKRLKECEKLFVAIEISGWLNDYQLCQQAIVQCYGLLVPLLYHRVSVIPAAQVLLQCLAALHEIPVSVRQKRPLSTSESLHHMTATMAFHAAKMLFEFNEKTLASRIYDAGIQMVQMNLFGKKNMGLDSNQVSGTDIGMFIEDKLSIEPKMMSQSNLLNPKSGSKKSNQNIPNKDNQLFDTTNEEFVSLEIGMYRLNKLITNENDLATAFVHDAVRLILANIYQFPSIITSKEVSKYKKRANYPEFYLRVVEKAIWEGNHTLAQTFAEDLYTFIKKKNETNFGIKYKKQMKRIKRSESSAGENPQKYSAKVVEYSKTKESMQSIPEAKSPSAKKRNKKKKLFPNDPPELERAKMHAIGILTEKFYQFYSRNKMKKASRKVLADELPLQTQLLLFTGIAQFGNCFEKTENFIRGQTNITHPTNYGSYHDDNWFSFENTGMLLSIESKSTEDPKKIDKKKSPLDKKERTNPSPYQKFPTIQLSYTGATSQTVEMNAEGIQEVLRRGLSHILKSMVLAHRGSMWSLFQNGAKILWDMIQTIQSRLVSISSEPSKEVFYFSLQAYHKLVCPVIILAADYLLDMLKKLQEAENNSNISTEKEKQEEPNAYLNSFFGSIENEKRGSLLKFEPFQDDTIVFDIRLVQKICLKAIAIAYSQKKWEHLADLILRFNAITNDRFGEFTLPLLMVAQKNLLDYIESLDEDIPNPQPHIRNLMEKVGSNITAKDYLYAQFKITLDKNRIVPVPMDARLDLSSGKIYNENTDGCRLVSVPLDIDYTWKCLEKLNFDISYGARALNQSRRLLGLYLLGQQQLKYEELAKEEKIMKPCCLSLNWITEPLPQPNLDIFYEDIHNTLTSNHAHQLLDKVITSYTQTADVLLSKNETELAAQAFTELGNLYFVSGIRKMASSTWNRSLKLILGLNEKPLLNWKEVFTEEDPGLHLLQTCGIWGCLHGGIAATNIARYAVSNDWLSILKHCFLAYHLFTALFRSSVQHPLSDRQYAAYEIGEMCTITYLIPGTHIFTDQYRCNTKQLLASLQFVISKLYLYQHYLKILPLLTLNLYVARSLCRDVKLTVQCQIQKLLTLTDLHLFSDAIKTLMHLLQGERLPQTGSPYFRPVEIKMEPLDFNSALTLNDPLNLKVFEALTEKSLPSNLQQLYGNHLHNELVLAHAHLLNVFGECLDVIPDDTDPVVVPVTPVPPSPSPNPKKSIDISRRLSSLKDPGEVPKERSTSMEKLKHNLISSAKGKMDQLMEELLVKSGFQIEKLEAGDLNLAIFCSLELSNICLQKQQTYFAAKHCCRALYMLQNSKLFTFTQKPAKPKRRSTNITVLEISRRNPDGDSQSKSVQDNDEHNPDILGCQQWLHCRLRLVQVLLTDVSKTFSSSDLGEPAKPEMESFEILCQDGQVESKTWNNLEMEAAFVYVEFLKTFDLTHCPKTCRPLLKKGIKLLRSCPELSYSGVQNLLTFLLFETDLRIGVTGPLPTSKVKKSLKSYMEIEELAEKLVQDLGEGIHHRLTMKQEPITCPVIPLKNIYLSPYNILVQVKLRIGLMMTKLYLPPINLCSAPDVQQRNSYLLDCLTVLQNARTLNRKCFFWNAGLEIEILLQIGKLEREMASLKMISPFTPMSTFLDAIKISFFSRHSLILMKNIYLEIALIAINELKKPESFVCQRTKAKSSISNQLLHFSILGPNTNNNFSMIAWLAIRCAAIIMSCRQNITNLTLPGKLGINNELSPDAKRKVPQFLNLDLFGKYVFGKRKKFYKNEFEEEYDKMMEAGASEVIDNNVRKMKEITEFSNRNITWSYILYYSLQLFEQQHRAMVSVNHTIQQEEDIEAHLAKQSHTTYHQAFLCSLNMGSMCQMRYSATYSFLAREFSIFSKQCSISFLPPKLEDLIELGNAPPGSPSTSETPSGGDRFSDFQSERVLPTEFQKSSSPICSEQKLPYPNVNEVCFQWYSPSLHSIVTAMHQDQTPIYLMCAVTKKREKPGELGCLVEFFLFPHYFITGIYKRIKKVIHLKEIQQKTPSPMQMKADGMARKPSKGNITISPTEISIEAEAELQKDILLILEDIETLLKPNSPKLAKSPFELNNHNLNQLLKMFDVSSGSSLITSDIAPWILKLLFPKSQGINA